MYLPCLSTWSIALFNHRMQYTSIYTCIYGAVKVIYYVYTPDGRVAHTILGLQGTVSNYNAQIQMGCLDFNSLQVLQKASYQTRLCYVNEIINMWNKHDKCEVDTNITNLNNANWTWPILQNVDQSLGLMSAINLLSVSHWLVAGSRCLNQGATPVARYTYWYSVHPCRTKRTYTWYTPSAVQIVKKDSHRNIQLPVGERSCTTNKKC